MLHPDARRTIYRREPAPESRAERLALALVVILNAALAALYWSL